MPSLHLFETGKFDLEQTPKHPGNQPPRAEHTAYDVY